MSDHERFDIDVSYRDPVDRPDGELYDDRPTLNDLRESLEPGDMIAGRWEVEELVAVWGDNGWECPFCGGETNGYGHGHQDCRP